MPRPVITERKCCCANALPNAPGEVPVLNAGFPIQEFLPQGRAPQSTAFLRTAGMERSCSGVTISTPSARAISFLKRATSGGRLPSLSWLYIGRSSMRAKTASNLPAPSRTSAWASLQLMESRRFEPTITARRGKCIESSMVESPSDKSPLAEGVLARNQVVYTKYLVDIGLQGVRPGQHRGQHSANFARLRYFNAGLPSPLPAALGCRVAA